MAEHGSMGETLEEELKVEKSESFKNWSDKEILEYWEHPDTQQLIINAVPLDQVVFNVDGENFTDSVPEGAEHSTGDGVIVEFPKHQRKVTVTKPRSNDSLLTAATSMLQSSMLQSMQQVLRYSRVVADCADSDSEVSTPAAVMPPTVELPKMSTFTTTSASQPQHMLAAVVPPPVKQVPENMCTHYPYNSVGKLFWFHPWYDPRHWIDKDKIMYWVTAFYIGNDTIMTVAHTFDKETEVRKREGVFVPAMIDNKDTQGKHYGYYRVYTKSRNVHPFYEEKDNSARYDICTIELGLGRHDKKEVYLHQFLQPIIPTVVETCIPEPTWTVLGYPYVFKGKQGGQSTAHENDPALPKVGLDQ